MRCFLVARFDATVTPPVLLGLGVYSEGWNTLTLAHSRQQFYADLAVGEGDDFAEARAALMLFVDSYPGLHWVREWLKRESEETAPKERTRITHVAIRFQGKTYSLPTPPNRHHHVVRLIVQETGADCVDVPEDDQGFLDAGGAYLRRRQALVNARMHGQLKPDAVPRAGRLFSEDLREQDPPPCEACDGLGSTMVNAHGPQEVSCGECGGTGVKAAGGGPP
jgi:hypothetical protein